MRRSPRISAGPAIVTTDPALRPSKITATRESDGCTATCARYDVLSARFEPERFHAVARAHWTIENALHWVPDVNVHEDNARNRTKNGPENLAVLRRVALNLAGAEPSKGSMRANLKRAGLAGRIHVRFDPCRMNVQKRWPW